MVAEMRALLRGRHGIGWMVIAWLVIAALMITVVLILAFLSRLPILPFGGMPT